MRWAIIAVTGGIAVAGAVYMVGYRESFAISATAHAANGSLLSATCWQDSASPQAGEATCFIKVRNTACRTIATRAHVQTSTRSGFSNEVATRVNVAAKDVCVHVCVDEGYVVSGARFAGGRPIRRLKLDREVLLLLGDMDPAQEATVEIRARRTAAAPPTSARCWMWINKVLARLALR